MSAPYIPATALKGDIITGWSGPCEVLAHARFPVALPDAAHLAMLQGKSAWVSCFLSLDACAGEALPRRNVCLDRGQNFSFDPSRCRMRLDPRRPEVAHRIADVLRRKGHEVGHLLPVALGGRVTDATVEERMAQDEGGGTLRRTIPAADVSALTLAASVAGVEAGCGVVRGVLSAWDDSYGVRWDRHGVAVAVGDDPLDAEFGVPPSRVGWSVQTSPGNILAKGPETGPGGRAAADAALLRLGYAYLDPAAPFGVVVPFLNLENER